VVKWCFRSLPRLSCRVGTKVPEFRHWIIMVSGLLPRVIGIDSLVEPSFR
jgi:hypothetical protein